MKKIYKKVELSKSVDRKPKQEVVDYKSILRQDFVSITLIIIVGTLIYSNSFNCSFHFDDLNNIVNNQKIRNVFDINTWWSINPSRPIAFFTFALNYHFNQLDVVNWHIFNLVVHIINALLIYCITYLLFSTPGLEMDPTKQGKRWIALFAALFFVSHPLATQSVTYIVQRMASMMAMFYLLSLVCYIKARLIKEKRLLKYLLLSGSLLSAVMAMLTKENAFTLPFALILVEIFFLQSKKFSIDLKDFRITLIMGVMLALIAMILFKFSLSIFKPILPSLDNNYTITPVNYLITQFTVIVKYIGLLFLPTNLNVDYDYPVANDFFEIKTIICFLLLISLLALSLRLYKRYRIISFGILWFFLTISIESSIVPIVDVIFEHRTYLPSFGFFLIISYGLYKFLWNNYKAIAIAIFVITIFTYSILTYERNKIWKDELTLLSDVILKSPNKGRPYINRGATYMNLGKWDKAVADYTKAININPNYYDAYSNRGAAFTKLGRHDSAIKDYSKAIEIKPDFAKAYFNRGVTYGNLGELDKAIKDYTKVIELDSNNLLAYSNRGVAFANIGDLDKAIMNYSKVIELDSTYAAAYSNRGIAYANLGKWQKAIADQSKVIELDPKSATAYYNRGVAFGSINQWDKSYADFTHAIELDPKFTNAYINRDIAKQNLNNGKDK